MGTPTDAHNEDFRVPSQKGKPNSGKERKEFSRGTPPGEDEKETPRREKKKPDDAQEGREGRAGKSRDPETSTCRQADAIKRPRKDTDQRHTEEEEVSRKVPPSTFT
ncbi:hypothetical protein NDU88_009180 [Pleurodeles waltl]|uniref:Uncharacterized protein n=1 Tax=Pleurodeles waltl TaxID=8319 RepID=A0AAV7P1G7_PLEWA|nr:hypothetical protein NDU88_009180 [Pleurodeles waltl]